MVHPVLTLLFDLLIIGTAVTVISAMVVEYRTHREPHIGVSQRRPLGAGAPLIPFRPSRTVSVGKTHRRRTTWAA